MLGIYQSEQAHCQLLCCWRMRAESFRKDTNKAQRWFRQHEHNSSRTLTNTLEAHPAASLRCCQVVSKASTKVDHKSYESCAAVGPGEGSLIAYLMPGRLIHGTVYLRYILHRKITLRLDHDATDESGTAPTFPSI